MPEFPYDSAIVATVISVGISIIMYIIAEKKIEPKKWKKNIELDTLEKQLEVYGTLVTLLQALRQKARREGYDNPENKVHLMELPEDIYKLEDIFEKKRHLLSEKLIVTYLDLVKNDSKFLIHGSKLGEKSNVNFMPIDLSTMQYIGDGEYAHLKKRYDDLVNG